MQNVQKSLVKRYLYRKYLTLLLCLLLTPMLLIGCGGGGDDDGDGSGSGYIIGPITNQAGFTVTPGRDQLLTTWREATILFPPNRDFPQVGSLNCPASSGNENCGANDRATFNADGTLTLEFEDETQSGTWSYNSGVLTVQINGTTEVFNTRLNSDSSRLEVIRQDGNFGRIYQRL